MGLAKGAVALGLGRSVTEGYFRSGRLARLILAAADEEPFDVVVAYSSSMLPYATAVPARGRVMDLVDADSEKWLSYAAAASGPRRWLFALEGRRVRALERRALEACDAVLLVSAAEAEALACAVPEARGKALAVTNGVDTEYFAPSGEPPAADGPPTLVFTGTMDYRPNVEGAVWFVREVWPRLRRERPDLEFVIVGRDPAPAVRRLAEEAGVRVTGSVPDVRPYLWGATLAVAPLRIARGIQNKVLEAMATALAVVASPQAAEGLEVEVGRDLVEADEPAAWCEAVLTLVNDDERRRTIGRAARERVLDAYRWPARMAPLVELCGRLANGG